jgi:general secretion pathway protein A
MYLNYYGLKQEPFHITPDPEFLFLSESHKQALASMMYAIEKKKGFAAITGGVGVGKTTILRSYLDRMDHEHLKLIYIFNPNIPFKSLVAVILQELGSKPVTYDISDMVHQLHLVLIDEYSAGRDVIVIIDEAQNMPIETLENLRMLSNLETSTDKLIQIILIGQSEFEEILDRYELRQLKQRIAIRSIITPLPPEESLAYIKHRLTKAGLKGGHVYSVFTKSALQLIIQQSKGIPRIINILCDNALITGFGHQQYPVTTKIVNEVISDFYGKQKKTYLFKWQHAALAALILLLFAFFMSSFRDTLTSILTDLFWGNAKEAVTVKEIKPAATPKANQAPLLQKKEPETSKQIQDKDQPDEPVIKVIGKGDNLIQLIEDVYGIKDRRLIDKDLMEFIRKNNPHIKDMNKILVGDKIIFPNITGIQIKTKG